jgi:hypothetical protein
MPVRKYPQPMALGVCLMLMYAILLGLHMLACIPAQVPDANLQHAEALWKANVRKQTNKTQHFETAQTVVFGTVDSKMLESIGKAAERAVVFAKKSVGYDTPRTERENQQMSERPIQWEGKLLVIVCKDRQEFIDLFSKFKDAKPQPGESAVVIHHQAKTYVLMGPSGQGTKQNAEILAVEFAGAATISRRHDPIPSWMPPAFGRLLAYKFDSKYFAAERSKVALWASERHVRDLFTNENSAVPAGSLLPLQTSLIDCLSQSPAFQDNWFKILDETAFRNGNIQAALDELKIKLESVQIEWKNRLWK